MTTITINSQTTGKSRSPLQSATATPPVYGWPTAVGEYRRRIVEFAVVYDGGFHSKSQRGQELVQPLVHGCFVDANIVLTCSEALELAESVAREKNGYVIILSYFIRYKFVRNHLHKYKIL